MNIDWSKAPADAEAGCCETSQTYAAWFRTDGNGQIEQICPKAGVTKWTSMGGRFDYPIGHELRPANWHGAGLPPVGTVCEFAGFNPEETLPTDPAVGDKVTVIAHYLSGCVEVAAFTFNCAANFGSLHVAQGAHGCFRPVRTAEQIAADERKAQILEMIDVFGLDTSIWGLDTVREICGHLWEAGYRKQVAP